MPLLSQMSDGLLPEEQICGLYLIQLFMSSHFFLKQGETVPDPGRTETNRIMQPSVAISQQIISSRSQYVYQMKVCTEFVPHRGADLPAVPIGSRIATSFL